MTVIRNTKNIAMKGSSQIHWFALAIVFIGVVILSFGLAYLLQNLVTKFNFPLYDFAWLAYLIVLGTSLVASLTIIAPVPFAVSVMVAAATKWDPLLVALSGSLGGTIGELSGYYAGYLGKKIAIPGQAMVYSRVERWIQHYGVWAIFLLALQPIMPFDIGGLVAGTAKMPLHKFLPALWAGKFPKYVILIYAASGVIRFIPFWNL